MHDLRNSQKITDLETEQSFNLREKFNKLLLIKLNEYVKTFI